MPIQETKAKLWFDTKEEEEAYDQRMIANIEIKEGDDPDSPHFTILAPRVRKEKMPSLSEKALKASNDLLLYDDTEMRLSHTYLNNHNWTTTKYMGGMALSYFLIRELPIRNFYARAMIFAGLYFKLNQNYKFSHILSGMPTTQVKQGDPYLTGLVN